MLNSRLLTYPYVDINDASPLTPSHFLCGHRLLALPDTRVSVQESDLDYILPDNAKTFKAGAQELQTMKNQVLKPDASQQFLANHNITWKFITERAPWWGGFYERLVGLVKRCLKKNYRQSLSKHY